MGFNEGDENHQAGSESIFMSGDFTFAKPDNLDHCVKYLNQSLVTFGFPASLDLFSIHPVAVARTCNCIYALLQQRQRDLEFRDSSNEQRQRLHSDISRLEAKVERLDGQLATKERELAAITRAEQKSAAELKARIDKLQQERDEFQRMVIGHQQVRTQQIHEMKKKEKEYLKLQERLNQVLMEKKKESKSGMEIMNLLQVDAYEVKKQELMSENNDLRALLRSMQLDMRDFLNSSSATAKLSSTNDAPETEPPTPLGGRTDVFDLPFALARDQIEQSLRAKMASIKERMFQLQESQKESQEACEASERELELEAQLVEARSIIQEQASIMSKQLPKSDPLRGMVGHIGDNQDTTTTTANEERAVLDERTKQLDTERSVLRKMAMELEKERCEMDRAKHRLEEEQASWEATLKPWGPGLSIRTCPGNVSEERKQIAGDSCVTE